jgi:arabinofuranan 3-O-arabinosyltransferase
VNATWLTAVRVRRAHVYALVGFVILGFDAWVHTRHGVTSESGEQLGRDFINYWSGAHLAAEGHAATVYDIPAFLEFERAHTAPNAEFKWYSYPPIALLLSMPLATTGFISGLVFWTLSGFAICGTLLTRLLGWQAGLTATLSAPAAFINAWSGQNGQYTAALMGGGIMLLETQPYFAGILFGALCFKPQLAVLIPIALAAGGHWRAFGSSAVTAIALCAATVILFWTDSWAAFQHSSPLNLAILQDESRNWHRMPTIFAMVRKLGGAVQIAFAAQIVSAVAAALIVIRIWRGDSSIGIKGSALIIATFLATPYAWDYDCVMLTFAIALFLVGVAPSVILPYEKYLLAIVAITPALISPIAVQTHLQLGPLILLAALLMVARRSGMSSEQINTASKSPSREGVAVFE